MKIILKIFLILGILFSGFQFLGVEAGIVLPTDEIDKIDENSINISSSGNIVDDINDIGINVLTTIKLIFEGVLIIYIVYAGIQMIISMGSDEEELSSAKRSIRYSMIGIVFINIPGGLYNAFKRDNYGTIDGGVSYNSWFNTPGSTTDNVLVNFYNFGKTLNGDIIGFIEVTISAIAIVFIIISGIKIIKSRGNDEDFGQAKTKITWSIIGLVFIGFIEAWKAFMFNGDIDDGRNLFETISNLALFFAGPVAIFFLTLAAYYYINSNGDEERIKKAKNIVLNTVIATVILLASYTFLLDLATL